MTRQQLAKKLAKKAGSFLFKNFNKFKAPRESFKANHEIVTQYDKQAEQIIIKGIKKYFPQDAILSEEAGSDHKQSEYLWVVDPLDGTTNFVMYNPIFSVSIGLFKVPQKNMNKARVVFGAIYVPVLNDLYTAKLKGGAWHNNRRIKVSKIKDFIDAQHTYCHGSSQDYKDKAVDYYSKIKKAGVNIRQLGSAAIELALVASGRNESIVIPGANSWDVAAGVLLVREAGGLVTDAKGKPWRFGSRDMIATNRLVHTEVLRTFNNA